MPNERRDKVEQIAERLLPTLIATENDPVTAAQRAVAYAKALVDEFQKAEGNATKKQRQMVYAAAKTANMPLENVLSHLGISSLDQINWQMIDDALAFIRGETQSAQLQQLHNYEVSDEDIPF